MSESEESTKTLAQQTEEQNKLTQITNTLETVLEQVDQANKASTSQVQPDSESTAEAITTIPPKVFSPNSSYFSTMINKVVEIIKEGKKIEEGLTTLGKSGSDIAKKSTEELKKMLDDVNVNESIKQFLKPYIALREKFDKVEQQILLEATEMLGLKDRGYLITPLKDLFQEIKETNGKVDLGKVQMYLQRLLYLVGFNQLIDKSNMIPYVGPVINGVMDSLDSYTSSQDAVNSLVKVLKEIGVPAENLCFITAFTQDTYFTKKYKIFKEWLVKGGEFNLSLLYPFNMFGEFRKSLNKEVRHYFIFSPNETPETEIGSSLTHIATPQTANKQGGGSIDDWAPIGKVKSTKNKKTRNCINKINKTIKSYITRLRLRRTRRKPFGKSVASLNIKRGF